MKEKLLTLTKKDFKIDTYRGSGPGGQHRNKTDSCVRITHIASGISASCCEHKSQHKNKETAFRRLSEDKKLRAWLLCYINGIEEKVEELMKPENIKVEYL